MKINRNSWHYKLYNWTYYKLEDVMPQSTNLCQYVQRLIFGTLLSLFFVFFFTLIIYFVCGPVVLFFGFYPDAWNNNHNKVFIRYYGWQVRGFELLPWHAAAVGLIGFFQWLMFHHFGWQHVLTAEVAALIVITAIWRLISPPKDGAIHLMYEWAKAKKQGVCPLIEFEDDNSN